MGATCDFIALILATQDHSTIFGFVFWNRHWNFNPGGTLQVHQHLSQCIGGDWHYTKRPFLCGAVCAVYTCGHVTHTRVCPESAVTNQVL